MDNTPTLFSDLGKYLSALRTRRGYSLQTLARQAQVSARTLSFWEANTHKPRLPELDATLAALHTTPEERVQALLLLGTAQATRHLHREKEEKATDALHGGTRLGPMPSGGDLLRALRYRHLLPLESAAQQIGVSAATLSRWESGKIFPDPERLPRVFQVLKARPEEQGALTDALSGTAFFASVFERDLSVESLAERFIQFQVEVNSCGKDDLRDLHFLLLEAQAWHLARTSREDAAGRSLLAEMYACHASSLSAFGRFREIAPYANRTIALLTDRADRTTPSHTLLQAIIALAQAQARGRGDTHQPMRGAAFLNRWTGLAEAVESTRPAHAAWMLSCKAQYLSRAGYTEAALALGERSCRIAERAEPIELRLRERDLARLLLDAGKAREALALVTSNDNDNEPPFWQTQVYLLRAEGLLLLHDKPEALEWMTRALNAIRTFDLTHLQNRADQLVRRFEKA